MLLSDRLAVCPVFRCVLIVSFEGHLHADSPRMEQKINGEKPLSISPRILLFFS